LSLLLDNPMLKTFQLQGGFQLPASGASAPGPCWGLRPQTPVIGSRSALALALAPIVVSCPPASRILATGLPRRTIEPESRDHRTVNGSSGRDIGT